VEIKYGDKVRCNDGSALDGCVGMVIKVVDIEVADILLGKEIILTMKLDDLELVP